METELLKTEVSEIKQKLINVEQIKFDLELKLSESEELRFSTNALWFGLYLLVITRAQKLLHYSMYKINCNIAVKKCTKSHVKLH